MQKIAPFLWFDNNAEEAMDYYVQIFPDSKVLGTMPGPDGKPMGGTMRLAGYDIMTLNGSPQFKINPSISLFVTLASEEEVDNLWAKLSDGGETLMPLQEYPFSKKYGWTSDKYGVNWQLSVARDGQPSPSITPSLMFTGDNAGKAEEAIKFYTSLFDNSKVEMVSHYEDGPDKGRVNFGLFQLHGQNFSAMDSSLEHKFTFNEAVSLFVNCEDQAEVDTLWNKLTADGGEESQCGWLKDKYGVSWQIIPQQLMELMSDPDHAKAGRAMQAMLKMKKISIADLEHAAAGGE